MKKTILTLADAVFGLSVATAAVPASAANVKITLLGGQKGKFCRLDRAIIFEDPDARGFCMTPDVPSPAMVIPAWGRSP